MFIVSHYHCESESDNRKYHTLGTPQSPSSAGLYVPVEASSLSQQQGVGLYEVVSTDGGSTDPG